MKRKLCDLSKKDKHFEIESQIICVSDDEFEEKKQNVRENVQSSNKEGINVISKHLQKLKKTTAKFENYKDFENELYAQLKVSSKNSKFVTVENEGTQIIDDMEWVRKVLSKCNKLNQKIYQFLKQNHEWNRTELLKEMKKLNSLLSKRGFSQQQITSLLAFAFIRLWEYVNKDEDAEIQITKELENMGENPLDFRRTRGVRNSLAHNGKVWKDPCRQINDDTLRQLENCLNAKQQAESRSAST